jgi:hypothetical protein
MNKLYAGVAMAMVLFSCSSSQDVVQDGPFQHRKYINKGWFIDVPKRRCARAGGSPARERAPSEATRCRHDRRPEEVMEPASTRRHQRTEATRWMTAPPVEAALPRIPGPSASLGESEQDPVAGAITLERDARG